MTTRRRLLAGVVGVVCVVSSVACSAGDKSAPELPDSSPYHITSENPAPGEGVLQLGAGRYPFTVVNCGTGPVKGDEIPEMAGTAATAAAQRSWGLYGNGHTEGRLFTVAITQYRSQVADGPVTITQSALVRMDVPADGFAGVDPDRDTTADTADTTVETTGTTTTVEAGFERLGLMAQRFRPEASTTWTDQHDRSATDALVQITGDTYVATGYFGASDDDARSSGGTDGQVTARCPEAPSS